MLLISSALEAVLEPCYATHSPSITRLPPAGKDCRYEIRCCTDQPPRALRSGFTHSVCATSQGLGYESVWTAEHVIFPKEYASIYPYNPSGKLRFKPDDPIIDPLVTLITFIAAATQKLRLGTGINILPQTNPLYLAKWCSSIDHLSKGRLILGVGIGWLREEFEALGVPFERRGKRADEYMEALRAV